MPFSNIKNAALVGGKLTQEESHSNECTPHSLYLAVLNSLVIHLKNTTV